MPKLAFISLLSIDLSVHQPYIFYQLTSIPIDAEYFKVRKHFKNPHRHIQQYYQREGEVEEYKGEIHGDERRLEGVVTQYNIQVMYSITVHLKST